MKYRMPSSYCALTSTPEHSSKYDLALLESLDSPTPVACILPRKYVAPVWCCSWALTNHDAAAS